MPTPNICVQHRHYWNYLEEKNTHKSHHRAHLQKSTPLFKAPDLVWSWDEDKSTPGAAGMTWSPSRAALPDANWALLPASFWDTLKSRICPDREGRRSQRLGPEGWSRKDWWKDGCRNNASWCAACGPCCSCPGSGRSPWCNWRYLGTLSAASCCIWSGRHKPVQAQ